MIKYYKDPSISFPYSKTIIVIDDEIHEFVSSGFHSYRHFYSFDAEAHIKQLQYKEITVHEFNRCYFAGDQGSKLNIEYHSWTVKIRRPLITIIFS